MKRPIRCPCLLEEECKELGRPQDCPVKCSVGDDALEDIDEERERYHVVMIPVKWVLWAINKVTGLVYG